MAGNRSRTLSAWLALLAMLLIVIAPVISQSLALNRVPVSGISLVNDHSKPLQSSNASGGHHSHDNADVAIVSTDEQPFPAEHSNHGIAECGYCVLMVNLPVLVGYNCCFLNIDISSSEPAQPGSGNSRPIKAVFPNALSRAPPFFAHDTAYPRGARPFTMTLLHITSQFLA